MRRVEGLVYILFIFYCQFWQLLKMNNNDCSDYRQLKSTTDNCDIFKMKRFDEIRLR